MKNIKLTELKERFEMSNEIRGLSTVTREYYDRFLSDFMAWLPKNVTTTKKLTREIFERYEHEILTRMPNRTSANTYLRAVRRFYNFGAEIGVLQPQKLKLPKTQRTIKPTFSDEEIEKIINTRGKDKAEVIALLLLTTGIRSATLRTLTTDDISETENTLTLRHLKNGTQAILPIPERITQTLSRYIRKNGIKKGGLLFPNNRGEKYTRNGLYEYLTKYLKRRGFEHYGVHIFRHTYAKLLAKEGCPSITLARCLTHSTIAQSEHYVNLYGAELRTACERFNPVFTVGKAPGKRSPQRDGKGRFEKRG